MSRSMGVQLIRLVLALFLVSAASSLAQAKPTAIRDADLQIGGGYVNASSDFSTVRYNGFAFYTTLDLKPHYGAEFNIHRVSSPQGDQVYEQTYEWGFRYHRTYGRFLPYARVMYGRGVFNYPRNSANLGYNMFVLGGGVDYTATNRINIRADYEYETWRGFTPQGLTPQLITIGVAYHFPGTLTNTRRHR